MLEHLDQIDWTAFPGPKWYRPHNIPAAIKGLASRAGLGVGHQALSAFGNDHAGTYYPAVFAVLPFLREILEQGDRDARMATMAVFDDLTYFSPEPEFSVVLSPNGEKTPLVDLVKGGMLGFRDTFEALASSSRSDEAERTLAREILARLTELEIEER